MFIFDHGPNKAFLLLLELKDNDLNGPSNVDCIYLPKLAIKFIMRGQVAMCFVQSII